MDNDIYDPLEEDQEIDFSTLLPIHYRIAIWIANHLVLYSIVIAGLSAGITYYLNL